MNRSLECKNTSPQTRIALRDCKKMHFDNSVKYGSLVEVLPGPLRVSDDPHNFGIVADMPKILGMTYADVVTNTGRHRLIMPEHLQVLGQIEEEK